MSVTEEQASVIKYYVIPQAYLEKFQKLDQFDASIKTFADYEQLKRSLNRQMGYIDYQHLIKAYEGQAKDSTISKEERIKYYLKLY